MSSVATAIGVEVRDGVVRAEGLLDFRGTLSIGSDVPVGFQRIDLHFDLDTDASDEQLATLIRLTERYCVVYQTLRNPPRNPCDAASQSIVGSTRRTVVRLRPSYSQ